MPIYHQTVLLPQIEFFCNLFFCFNLILGFKFLEQKRTWWRIKQSFGMDTRPPDTSGSGFGQQVDRWVGGRGALCSPRYRLHAPRRQPHYNPRCSALMCKQIAQQCIALPWSAWLCIALHCSDLIWITIALPGIVCALCKTLSCSTSA